jgi:putative toxin-antitoxin system antitoxin component (TIGR02293 family)
MVDVRKIARLLGGKSALQRRIQSFGDFALAIEDGFPREAMRAFMDSGSITAKELSEAVRIPARTLMRIKTKQRLPADESDKVYRLAYILVAATNVFGDQEKAGEWLRRPNRALGGATPLSLLSTQPGLQQVEQVLGRIEFGEYS